MGVLKGAFFRCFFLSVAGCKSRFSDRLCSCAGFFWGLGVVSFCFAGGAGAMGVLRCVAGSSFFFTAGVGM